MLSRPARVARLVALAGVLALVSGALALGALPPERAEAFADDLRAFFRREETEDGLTMSRPYLLVVGTRKG